MPTPAQWQVLLPFIGSIIRPQGRLFSNLEISEHSVCEQGTSIHREDDDEGQPHQPEMSDEGGQYRPAN